MRLLALLLVLAPVIAGCFHADPAPVPEEPIAIFDLRNLDGERRVQFEVPPGVAWWRTDLQARSQRAVTYVAESPSGAVIESEPAAQFPYAHALRVENPQAGTWNLTIRAQSIVAGTLQILVPA